MKEYCVDLEIAKELEKYGFDKECLYKHRGKINPDRYELDMCALPGVYFQAPTADEILQELPKFIEYDNGVYDKNIAILHIVLQRCEDNKSEYAIYYLDDNIFFETKLSNALAKMYICLKKEGYIK